MDERLRKGIAQRVRSAVQDVHEREGLIESLTAWFMNRLEEREKEIAQTVEEIEAAAARREQALEAVTQCAVVLWDEEGRLEYMNSSAREVLQFQPGTVFLGPTVIEELAKMTFPTDGCTPPEEAEPRRWSPEVYRLALAIETLIRDRHGKPLGAVLRGRSGRDRPGAPSRALAATNEVPPFVDGRQNAEPPSSEDPSGGR